MLDADLTGLVDLFDTLDPPAKVEVVDAYGNEYTLRTTVSARRQIRVFRQIQSILGMEIVAEARTGDFMDVLGKVLASEDVMLKVAEAFAQAYPKTAKAALAAAEEEEGEADLLDAFAIEELLTGVLPFFARMIKRGMSLVQSVPDLPSMGEETTMETVAP